MKNMHKVVFALGALAVFGASAETYYSGQADQERRERNREEALSHYRGDTTTTSYDRRESVREKAHDAARSMRHGAHEVAAETRSVTHRSANAVRRVGHKTAVKARDITDRTNARFGTSPKGDANPQGINPVGVSSASPTAPSNGVTK